MDKPQAGFREQSAAQLPLIIPCLPPRARSFPAASGRAPVHSFPRRNVSKLLPFILGYQPCRTS